MRVIIVNRMLAIARGGGENVDLNFARALSSAGVSIGLLVGRRWRGIDWPIDQFPTTYVRTPYLRWLMYWGEHMNRRWARVIAGRGARVDMLLFELAALKCLLANDLRHADIYQLCGLPGLAHWIERVLQKPALVRWPGPPGPMLGAWLGKYSANIANGAALENARLFDPGSYKVPIGVDTDLFRPSQVKQKHATFDIPEDAVVVLYVGRLIPIKNVSFLINGFAKAVKRGANLWLAVIGEGIEKNGLRQACDRIGVSSRVLFLGDVTGERLAHYYRNSDIFALTSNYDNFPNVILEAMASGLPVVATAVGGIPELIVNGVNGILIDNGQEENLVDSLSLLSTDAAMRTAFGRVNRHYVAGNCSWSTSAITLLDLYTKLLKRGQGGRFPKDHDFLE